MSTDLDPSSGAWRERVHEIIFEADTPAGKAFDVGLILLILLSIVAVMLDSVAGIAAEHGLFLSVLEWIFTILFTVEYVLRLTCVRRPLRYATSFFGVVDLLAILPTFVSVMVSGTEALLTIRVLRVLRVFRVLKLASYVSESEALARALYASRRKVSVFLFTVFTLSIVFGALMYVVEGPENGFTSIPRGVYWALVTLTTVGYGDIAPQTDWGQAVATLIMVLGYGIIAVPTGIVTAELVHPGAGPVSGQACPECGVGGHRIDSKFCRFCGSRL